MADEVMKDTARVSLKPKEATMSTGFFDLFGKKSQVKQSLEASRARLFRMAMAWTGEPALADDLVQETMTRALQKYQQLRDPERLGAWLFRILSNCWREHLRRQRPGVSLDDIELVDAHSPEHARQQQDVVSRVRLEIGGLPMGQRQVLTLVDLEGFSYAEAAEVLEIPVGTVMSRLNRARTALRERLGDMRDEVCKPEPEEGAPHLRRVK
jgi:RNA polymerase sigma-70 factor (ECF subfamily)